MANSDNDVESGRIAWFWFETEACKIVWPQEPHHQIDAHVNALWRKVPAYVRHGLLPALSKLRASYQRAQILESDLNNTQCLPLNAFDNCPEAQLSYLWTDHFARADDRLALARKLVDAAHAATKAFLEVSQFHNDYPGTSSFEGQQGLRNIAETLRIGLSDAEHELRQVERTLPERRRLEEKSRMGKRERGDPQGVDWVGAWFLGSGAFGKASLWVRQDARGYIVDVGKNFPSLRVVADDGEAYRRQRRHHRRRHELQTGNMDAA